MKKHVKVYLDHFKIGEQDIWQCEGCARQDHIVNFDIHHIHGRGKDKDTIDNLMCLCRKCHERAHSSKHHVNSLEFQLIHNYFMQGTRKAFLK